MEKFLYGAAVQGIQGFIFQTNKLKQIAGASELVEEICTSKFAEVLGAYSESSREQLANDPNCIVHAAGNVKYLFESRKQCERVVRTFPKIISSFAPGITISQAVVAFNSDTREFSDVVNELEKKLRIQRNLQQRGLSIGFAGMKRSRQTGLPCVYIDDDAEYMDAGTFAKLQYVWDINGTTRTVKRRTTRNLCNKAFGMVVKDSQIAYDIESITKKNDWIACVHIDGNGLGQVVQKIGIDKNRFKLFSEKLDLATVTSAVNAFNAIKSTFSDSAIIPIRPVVLGGDDFTFICRADLALDYTEIFMREFEKNTETILVDDNGKSLLANVFENEKTKRLTSCAGIAYIKSSFPFYYGYELAEILCSEAKKDAKSDADVVSGKSLPLSCLMFHKVQDSFAEDWSSICKRELLPQENVSFKFGPYYIQEKPNRWSVGYLKNIVSELDSESGNALKSGLRNWMSVLHENTAAADQLLNRIKSITELKELANDLTNKNRMRTYKDEEGHDKMVNVYPVYDALTIKVINSQTTK
jgi:hypothetical protein